MYPSAIVGYSKNFVLNKSHEMNMIVSGKKLQDGEMGPGSRGELIAWGLYENRSL